MSPIKGYHLQTNLASTRVVVEYSLKHENGVLFKLIQEVGDPLRGGTSSSFW